MWYVVIPKSLPPTQEQVLGLGTTYSVYPHTQPLPFFCLLTHFSKEPSLSELSLTHSHYLLLSSVILLFCPLFSRSSYGHHFQEVGSI